MFFNKVPLLPKRKLIFCNPVLYIWNLFCVCASSWNALLLALRFGSTYLWIFTQNNFAKSGRVISPYRLVLIIHVSISKGFFRPYWGSASWIKVSRVSLVILLSSLCLENLFHSFPPTSQSPSGSIRNVCSITIHS